VNILAPPLLVWTCKKKKKKKGSLQYIIIHVIYMQMRPSFIFPNESSHLPVSSQTWQKSGSCPEGSVPIRRVGRQELLRAASLEHLGRDGQPPTFQAVNTKSDRFIYYNGTKITMIPKADHSVNLMVYLEFV
jgi:hypothetical protein